MSGMKPKFIMEEPSAEYYATPDPYKEPPACDVNLLELSRYAQKKGKTLVELTPEEIELFKKL